MLKGVIVKRRLNTIMLYHLQPDHEGADKKLLLLQKASHVCLELEIQ